MLEKARYLRELAETHGLHGLYFQHIALCRRRAWLHLMGATHAVRHSRVRRGLALHQTEKRPGAVPPGLGIAPDAIDFARRVVVGRKGSARARTAVSRQAITLRPASEVTTSALCSLDAGIMTRSLASLPRLRCSAGCAVRRPIRSIA